MTSSKIPPQPFEKIALSCSGGGYRAASFHLGAMSYLNRLNFKGKPLLEHVKLISTVSGGTITGAVYALKKQRGESFEDIYNFLLQKLRTLDLVKSGIEKLNPEAHWNNPYKHKNLINAFAELYDRELTEGACFDVFNEMKSHLEAVVFNSTEFNHGINFRFRSKGSGLFGNKYKTVTSLCAQEVKLADAIASSSCFTGGFEPIIWPQDFLHSKAVNLQKLASEIPTGLMDGGIYDNQGIDSILMYKQDGKEPYFDLIIVSDVTSPYMKAYLPAGDKPKEGLRSLTLKDIKRKAEKLDKNFTILLVVFLAVFVALPFISGYNNNIFTGVWLGIAFMLISVLLAKIILIIKLKKFLSNAIKSLVNKIPAFYVDKLSHLQVEKLSIRRLEPLVMDRLNSLLTLVSDVFLKIVRRLNYYKIYDNNKYQYRRISNLIRELTETDYENSTTRQNANALKSARYFDNSILNGPYEKIIGPKIKEVAETASSFGTTLWFTKDEQLNKMLDKLVATGQFTMCYNMLDYLENMIFQENNGFDDLDLETQQHVKGMYSQCKKDWNEFKSEPMFMSRT